MYVYPKMDRIKIKCNKKSMFDLTMYFTQLYCEVSGKNVYSDNFNKMDHNRSKTSEADEIISHVNPHNNIKNVVFHRSRAEFHSKRISFLYESFVVFLENRCEKDKSSKILAKDLLLRYKIFTVENDISIDIDFQILMMRYLEENQNSGIIIQSSDEGIVYHGIKFNAIEFTTIGISSSSSDDDCPVFYLINDFDSFTQ